MTHTAGLRDTILTMHEITILCFGDSNTFGQRPDTNARYDESVRWPRRLGALLADETRQYYVIEEGLGGRGGLTLIILTQPSRREMAGRIFRRAWPVISPTSPSSCWEQMMPRFATSDQLRRS